ncbi:MAG: CDP-alcohol phosphatidyltransferase family protein [Candidatus Aureabacteria bacterium]|nr:CDP-alcohol phosphatidyltransferase family protein [Candidatus Auribacterota bacterium]
MQCTGLLIEGIVHLSIIVIILFSLTLILMGPENKDGKQLHPLFGKYTIRIPNIMSWLRLPFGSIIILVHLLPNLHTPFWFLLVHLSFFVACLFDYLDGSFARKWNAVTEDGKWLDPASDKFVTFCLSVTAFIYGELRWWAFAILIIREVISMIQRKRLLRQGIDVSARWLGKLKTGVQFMVLYILVLRISMLPGTLLLDQGALRFSSNMILWAMLFLCFCTVISLFPFFQSFSYVNDYTKTQREDSKRPWYIVAIPNLFTIGNYMGGVTAVYFAMPEVHVEYRPFVTMFWVCIAGIFDTFDGPIARKLKVHSEFGACLDSSTDLSTFGLATATIIFLQFSDFRQSFSLLGLFLAVFFFIFVHLRLARFTDLHSQQLDKGKKEDFVGLPSPAGAFTALILFTFFENPVVLSILIILVSLLMYSKFDYISHSNAFKNTFYRYLMIPFFLVGVVMLMFLLFQQPFVSAHTSRALIVYFNICSWILTVPLLIYIADGLRRGKRQDLLIE